MTAGLMILRSPAFTSMFSQRALPNVTVKVDGTTLIRL